MARDPLFQYQALAEPVQVPAADEAITLDKWFHQQPDPVRRNSRAHLVDSGPVVLPTAANETITLDKWNVQYPQPRRDVPVRRSQETHTNPLEPSLFVVPPYSWNRPTNYPRRPRKRNPEGVSVEPNPAATVLQSVTVDMWYAEPAVVVRRPTRPEGGTFAVPDFFDVPVPFEWFREPQVPVLRKLGVRPGTVEVDPVQVDVPQPDVPTDWIVSLPQPNRVRTRRESLSPQFDSWVEVVVLPSAVVYGWNMTPDPLPNRVKPRLPGHFCYVYEPTLYEVPPLGWLQPEMFWQRPEPKMHPSLEGGVYQGVPIANPAPDPWDWMMQHPQPDRYTRLHDAMTSLSATSGPPALIPTLPPPPVAPPLPGAGNDKSFVPRDPQVDSRHRRFQDVTSEVLNSLMGSAQLVQTGAKKWTLAGSEFVDDRAPNANDDETIGVRAGSRWVDTTAGTIWFNVDPATGAAVWKGPF